MFRCAINKWKKFLAFSLLWQSPRLWFHFLVVRFVEVVLVALINPVPLFGQHASFAAATASDSADECRIVELTLKSFDDSLRATESHKMACEFLQIIAKTRRGALKDYRSVIEKMLLWCLMIKKKSMFSIENIDLIEFISFIEAPPLSWVSIPQRRFIQSRKDVEVNYLWRPFRFSSNSSKWCRP